MNLLDFFKPKITKLQDKINALYADKFWAFSGEWWHEINEALSNDDCDRLSQLHDSLLEQTISKPQEFPMWWILPVPESIENQFAKSGKSKSDRASLHSSLAMMKADDQEEVVKKLIKFWIKKDQANVPDHVKDWVDHPKPVPVVVPHGAAAPSFIDMPKVSRSPDQFLESETAKLKQMLLTWQNVRVIGTQGSGKTSKGLWIAKHRLSLGHKVFWINSHLKYEDREMCDSLGIEVIGGGRNFGEIDAFFKKFAVGKDSVLSKSYDYVLETPNAILEPIDFILDEMTNYKDETEHSVTFVKSSVQEFSKLNWGAVYITHNDTLSCMGAPAGISDLLHNNLLDLRLEPDLSQGNRIPKAIGKYRMPSEHKWTDVRIPVEWQ